MRFLRQTIPNFNLPLKTKFLTNEKLTFFSKLIKVLTRNKTNDLPTL